MSGKSKQCPSCWLLVGPFETKCPRCGTAMGGNPTVMEPGYASKNWPPNSSGEPDEDPIVVRLMTNYMALDITLGVIASLLGIVGTIVTHGLSLVPVIAVYIYTLRKFPVFIRGMNYGFTSIVFIGLSPCLICIGAPVYSWLKTVLPWLPGMICVLCASID